jgi:Tol biopolymer transport system component/tRNA A-37 threonylcarbamoyl transferase component Bud32
MPLEPGSVVGPYEIVTPIGAGGMGEVYRARDSRLQRDVAIKVLPNALGVDADMLARFAREAQVLAQLNHPNIAAVYGVEEANGVRALVMELVEGPTLADVIEAASRDGRGLPVDEAIDIARQIALAMEVAHEQGIIHRDLKPGNVKLRPDGTVKVLDFGLAKAFDPISTTASSVAAHSPTLSMRATQLGLILGTAGYMSPEQAKGKAVDRRADIWAFGVVLYEMLCGRAMYTGETISEILARVIEREPDLTALPPETPRRLRDLLRRCLVKDPRNRLRDIGEARVALEEIARKPEEPEAPAAAVVLPPTAPVSRRAAPWGVAVLAIVVGGVVAWAPWRNAPEAPSPIRVSARIGAETSLVIGAAIALSPDGSVLAFVAGGDTDSYLYVRRLDQLEATRLSSTLGARYPFFSPDGQRIAFFADRKLKTVSINGGAAQTVCEVPDHRGGTWGDDGTIVFAAGARSGLMRVPDAGGTAQPLTETGTDGADVTHRYPRFLPGGRAVVFNTHSSQANFDDSSIAVVQVADRSRRILRKGGSNPIYLASGHLGYFVRGTLFVEPFDLETLTSRGAPFPLIEDVRFNPATGASTIAVAANGTLAYVTGAFSVSALLLRATDGKKQPQEIRSAPIDGFTLAMSPDGGRIAIDVTDGSQTDISIYDIARDNLTRLTWDPGDESKPAWTPDGARVAFGLAGKDGKFAVAWRRADLGSDVQRLVESEHRIYPGSWHPNWQDRKLLAYIDTSGAPGNAIKILPIEGDEAKGWKAGSPTTFLQTGFALSEPMFSPDGRWLAYMSNDGRLNEVYVRPFPGPGGQVQVSANGAVAPRWAPKAPELYFLGRSLKPMVASYTVSAGAFKPDRPREWTDVRMPAGRGPNRVYDLHPDGRMFLFQDPTAQTGTTTVDHVTLLFNVFEEIRRKAPRR